jgi:hypothetical protein
MKHMTLEDLQECFALITKERFTRTKGLEKLGIFGDMREFPAVKPSQDRMNLSKRPGRGIYPTDIGV